MDLSISLRARSRSPAAPPSLYAVVTVGTVLTAGGLHAPFLSDDRGFTGAERALLLGLALAAIVLGGHRVGRGSEQAARDARRVLLEQDGRPGALRPTPAAPRVAAQGTARRTLAAAGLLRFSRDFQPAPEVAPKAPRTTMARPGDTLSAIAARELGDAGRWRERAGLRRAP